MTQIRIPTIDPALAEAAVENIHRSAQVLGESLTNALVQFRADAETTGRLMGEHLRMAVKP